MARKRTPHVEPVSDDFLRSVAKIIGSSSAASAALAERDRRRDAGENAVVLWDRDRGVLLVGPDPSSERDGREG